MLQFLQEQFYFVYNSGYVKPILRIFWIVLVGLVLMKLIDSALQRLRLLIPPGDARGASRVEQRTETLRHIVRSVTKFILFIVVTLAISTEMGFDIRGILATVGIAGLAIGFGAQSLVKDFIAGFFILFEDQF